MIIAIEYYVGEMGFDDMLNSGYMIVNSYAAESDLLITPAGHINDDDSTLLDGANNVAIFNATVNNNEETYAIVTGVGEYTYQTGIQIINVTDPYNPKAAASVGRNDKKYDAIDGPYDVDTFTLDGSVYAAVTNSGLGADGGIQIINVTDPYNPKAAGAVASHAGNPSYLNGPQGLDIFNIGNYPYAIIADYYYGGDKEQEVTVINMTIPSNINTGTDLYHIDDKPKLVLARAHDVDTFTVDGDGSTYAIVTSRGDDGIQIIDVSTFNAPVIKGNLTDTLQSELEYASGVDTIKIGTDTYAIVTSGGDDTLDDKIIPSNIQIINVTDPDNPEAKGTLNENSVPMLNDPSGVETFTLDGSAYAIATSRGNGTTTSGGIQIINMADPDNPAAKGNATYDESKYPTLDRAKGVATFKVAGDNSIYAIVTSSEDFDKNNSEVNGVQIVRITNSDTTEPTLISSPTLDLNSHTLSFNFDETIDVSKIVWSDITINNANGASITSLVHFNLPSVDSSTFKIEFTGPVYRSMLAAIANEGPPRITVGDSAIRDFAGNYFDELVNGNLTVVGSTDRTGLLIIPAASITDNSTLALKNAYGVDIFYIDDNPYAVVASRDDNAIQIINMTDPYYPKASANVTYTAGNPTALKKSHGVATFDMGTGKYAIVTSLGNGTDKERGSIQIIDVTTPDAPVVKGRLVDNSISDINFLDGASGVDTFKIGADTYATVASRDDNAIQIIKMTDPDMPSYAGRETSGGGNTLDGANDVDTFTLDGSVYAIVASQRDDGFQIVDVSTPSDNPLPTGSGVDNYVENDSPYTGLRGASGVDTFKIDTDRYAIVASQRDDGFQIINVTTPGSPSAAGSGTDNDGTNDSLYTELKGAYGVDTFNMTDNNSMTSTYAIVASQKDNGIQIIDVTTPLTPSPAGSLSDNNALVLKASHDVATFKIGDCNTYAIATSRGDNGIQIIELIRELTPPVITLLGDNPQTIYFGGAYDELYATTDDDSPVTIDSFGVDDSKVGTYYVTYDSVDPSCNVATQVTRTVEVAVSPITLTPAGSITDGSDGYDVLEGASDVDIFNMTDSNNITSTYAIVASSDDNSFQIINVTDPYHPLPAGSGTDGSGGYTELLGANDVDTFEIGTDRYAIIASKDDDGFQIVDVSNPSTPTAAGSGTDNDGTNDSPYTVLDGASGVKTFEIGTDRYAIIASVRDSGIQIINMTTPSSPSAVNFGYTDPKGASGVDIFTIGDNPYAVVASKGELNLPGGFQIVNVTDPSRPLTVGSGTDGSDGYDVLDGASGVKTFEIGPYTYAIIASEGDDGFQIINVTTPSSPSPAGNGTDGSGGYTELDGAYGVDTFTVGKGEGKKTYAIVASKGDGSTLPGGFQIVDVSNPYRPLTVGSGTDNNSFSISSPYTELKGASGVKTFEISPYTYAIIASEDDDGVQMIRITDSDDIAPSLHDMKPYLDLVSGTLTFDFNETIDVSLINATRIEIKDNDDNLITNLDGSKLPSTDSYKFTITLTGPQYKSILAATVNEKGPLEINVRNNAIPDFYSNHAVFAATPQVVMPNPGDLFIIPAGNGVEHSIAHPTGYFGLDRVNDVDTFEIDNSIYAIITSEQDGFQIVNVTTPLTPKPVDYVSDIYNEGFEEYRSAINAADFGGVFDKASGVEIFTVGGDDDDEKSTYAIIANLLVDGFLIVDVSNPASMSAVGSGIHDSGDYKVLDEASDVDIFTVGKGEGKNTYAIVTNYGASISGIQIINITNPEVPSASGHVIGYDSKDDESSDEYLGLNLALSVDTFAILEGGEDKIYAIVASSGDMAYSLPGGFQIINVSNPGSPLPAGHGIDRDKADENDNSLYTELDGANDVKTFEIGTDTYAIIASRADDGFQIIDVTNPSNPSAAGSGDDGSGGYTELKGANGVDTFNMTDNNNMMSTYAIIVNRGDDDDDNDNGGIQIINMTDPHTPSAAGHFSDNLSTVLRGANAVEIFEIGPYTYAIVASKGDNSFQIVELTNDLTSPVITSILRYEQTNNTALTFRITFSEAVTGVTADDFAIADGATITAVTSVNGEEYDDKYDVTVNATDFEGTVGLRVAENNDIADRAGNALINLIPTGDNETFTVDITAPTVTSILRENPEDEQTNNTALTFRITFSEAVTGVTATAFATADGAIIATVASVNGEEYDDKYDVTVNATDFDGTVGLRVAENNDIADRANNALINLIPTGYNETFTVGTDNASPTAYAGDTQTVGEGTTVILNGTGSSDPDNDSLTYSWKQYFESGDDINYTEVDLSNATQPVATFDAPYVNGNQTLTFTLTVIDPGNLSNSATVTVRILDTDGSGVTNRAPIALVTAVSEVYEGTKGVQLNGEASSDPDDEDLTYSWKQYFEYDDTIYDVTLSNAAESVAKFDAPLVTSDQTLRFELTVSDEKADDVANVNILVRKTVDGNNAPIAHATAVSEVYEGAKGVQLDGSASTDDIDSKDLTYEWTYTHTGFSINLSSSTEVKPTFTAPDVSNGETIDINFTLKVTDKGGLSDTDTVTITVLDTNYISVTNVPPIAIATAVSEAPAGAKGVQLNGEASSDPDDGTLTYSWKQYFESGDTIYNAALSNSAESVAKFDAPLVTSDQTLRFKLTVSDEKADDVANVSILVLKTVDVTNQAPIALVTAVSEVYEGTKGVQLNGEASSDPDDEDLTYSWKQYFEYDDTIYDVTLSNAAESVAKFDAPLVTSDQTLRFELTVSDEKADDVVNVNILVRKTVDGNNAPIAHATAVSEVYEGAKGVQLDGSASTDDIDSKDLTYEWTYTHTGFSINLSSSTEVKPTFTAPDVSNGETIDINFTLKVTDKGGLSDTDTVTITVLDTNYISVTNVPPIAIATAVSEAPAGAKGVQLNGEASSDPDDGTLTYSWKQYFESGDTIYNAALSNSAESVAKFDAPLVTSDQTLRFKLTVSDEKADDVANVDILA